MKFLEGSLTDGGQTALDDILNLDRYSHSGAIAIPVRNRYAIITFGHGYSLIDWRKIVNNFGKKVIISSVEHDNFISVRSYLYDNHPRFVESQSTIISNLYEFELDFELQMLNRLTGDLKKELLEDQDFEDKDIGLRLTGSNSLCFSTYRPLDEMADLMTWFVEKYEEDNDDEFFQAIDTISPVEDRHLRADLNDLLVGELRDNANESFHLVVPFMIDYEEYQVFRIAIEGRNGVVSGDYSAPSITDYRAQLSRSRFSNGFTLDQLKSHHKLICVSNSGQDDRNRPIRLFDCLTGEVEKDGSKYALMGGKWYQIEDDFFNLIAGRLAQYVVTNSILTPFDPNIDIETNGNLSEAKYNERQHNAINNSIMLDREKIIFRGRGSVEPCDIMVWK